MKEGRVHRQATCHLFLHFARKPWETFRRSLEARRNWHCWEQQSFSNFVWQMCDVTIRRRTCVACGFDNQAHYNLSKGLHHSGVPTRSLLTVWPEDQIYQRRRTNVPFTRSVAAGNSDPPFASTRHSFLVSKLAKIVKCMPTKWESVLSPSHGSSLVTIQWIDLGRRWKSYRREHVDTPLRPSGYQIS